jgi:hypothetical protein
MYQIKKYSYEQAKKLRVSIKPSTRKGKKIDIYSLKGEYIGSIGAIAYKDYPTYMELERKRQVKAGTADVHRKIYKIRHERDRHKKGSMGFFADNILW